MIKKILLGLGILLFVIAGSIYFYFQSLKPTYNGEKTLSGLSESVDVHFDDYGIPHIYASSEADAYRALGYVHAQDRLFQMEVVRRIASGRLSEIFGSDMLKTDKFFRTIGIHRYSQKQADSFADQASPQIQEAANAYLDGINQFVADGPTPIEYTILGIEKSQFTLIDIYNAIGYMGFSFAAAQRIEPILTKIGKELGPEYLDALDLGSNSQTLRIQNFQELDPQTELASYVTDVMDNLPAPVWYGSNSWVVGPEKTKSGKVLLENDTHIKFAQPAVWYEAHLEAPGLGFYGYHVAGVPFAVLGHSRDYAIGMTMFTNDDIDFFQEKLSDGNDSKYVHKGEIKDFFTRKEIIQVKDSTEVEIAVRESVHGPIVNDVLELEGSPISMYWTYTNIDRQVPALLYEMAHAGNMSAVRKVASQIHAPGLNIMYGDAEGNIAWWASASLIQRPDETNSRIFREGASGENDPLNFYDFAENPKAENPPWGYVYSANNQTETTSGMMYPGHYAAEDRAKRIVTMLESKEKFSMDDIKEMSTDDQSENSPIIVDQISGTLASADLSMDAQKALDILKEWNHRNSRELIAPTIYNKLLYKILSLMMIDEIGEDHFKQLFTTHMIQRSTQPLMANDSTKWWDNVNTENIETRKSILTQALEEGVAELKNQLGEKMEDWKWGKVHTLEHSHPFGTVDALRKYFNVGPFPVDGSGMVINNLKFPLTEDGEYKVTAGPSQRQLVDFSDVENNSWGILPTGNSGNPFSPHYDDQAEMYANGKYRKQMMNESEIKSSSQNKLTLNP